MNDRDADWVKLLWICGQGAALPTTPQGQPQQQRSIHALPKPDNLTRQLHWLGRSAETIEDGLSHLGDADLHAIATYILELPPIYNYLVE